MPCMEPKKGRMLSPAATVAQVNDEEVAEPTWFPESTRTSRSRRNALARGPTRLIMALTRASSVSRPHQAAAHGAGLWTSGVLRSSFPRMATGRSSWRSPRLFRARAKEPGCRVAAPAMRPVFFARSGTCSTSFTADIRPNTL